MTVLHNVQAKPLRHLQPQELTVNGVSASIYERHSDGSLVLWNLGRPPPSDSHHLFFLTDEPVLFPLANPRPCVCVMDILTGHDEYVRCAFDRSCGETDDGRVYFALVSGHAESSPRSIHSDTRVLQRAQY